MHAEFTQSTARRELAGRAVLITGGGSGLGRATAQRIARAGACAIVADVEIAAAYETARLCEGDTAAVELDVTNEAQVTTRMAELCEQFGASFDCLINNAGTDQGADLLDITERQWHGVFAVNVDGPMFLTREFARRMIAAPHEYPADVVNVTSISAITVGTSAASYNCSKAALLKLTEVMQREANEYEWPVRIHGVMPSAMNTPMMDQWQLPDKVMMHPDTVASAIEFAVTLPPDTFVQNLIINCRREPGWPR